MPTFEQPKIIDPFQGIDPSRLGKDGRLCLQLPKIGVKAGKEMEAYFTHRQPSVTLNTSRHQSRKLQGLFKLQKVIVEERVLTPVASNEIVTTQNRSFSQGSLLKQVDSSRHILLEPLKTTRETQVSQKDPAFRLKANLKVLLKQAAARVE